MREKKVAKSHQKSHQTSRIIFEAKADQIVNRRQRKSNKHISASHASAEGKATRGMQCYEASCRNNQKTATTKELTRARS